MRQIINRESGPQARYLPITLRITFQPYSTHILKYSNSENPSLNIQSRAETFQYTPDLGIGVPLQVPPPSGQSLKITEQSEVKESERPEQSEVKESKRSRSRKSDVGVPFQVPPPVQTRRSSDGRSQRRTDDQDPEETNRRIEDDVIKPVQAFNHIFWRTIQYQCAKNTQDFAEEFYALRFGLPTTANVVHNRAQLCRTKKGTFRQHLIPNYQKAIVARDNSRTVRFSLHMTRRHSGIRLYSHSASQVLGRSASHAVCYSVSHAFGHLALQVLGHQASQLFVNSASRILGYSAFQVGNRLASLPFGLIDFFYWEVLQELPSHGQPITSTRRFSRNFWATDGQSRLLGCSPRTLGSRTTILVYWEVLQELLGHGQPITSTGRFSRNSWATDVLQELLGHGQPITSIGRFSRNSWATDGQFCLLGCSLGTPGSRTTILVYWDVLQELLGHGRPFTSIGRFSRNSWATDGQFRLLGSSPGTPGPRTTNLVYWEILQDSWATDNRSCLLGDSPGTLGPRTTVQAY
ncbi:hypothetical protein V8G54_024792 [Vigna mungo]|uniref:Uncharacterized protein n=1 Tax=Vigna mungo TaxID=3915 RepID=A0AAQ3N7F6_VIGMU